MTRDEELFVYAKLSTLEYFIEIIMAQTYGHASELDQEIALKKIVELSRTNMRVSDEIAHEPDALLLARLITEQTEHLANKIGERANQIRNQLRRSQH